MWFRIMLLKLKGVIVLVILLSLLLVGSNLRLPSNGFLEAPIVMPAAADVFVVTKERNESIDIVHHHLISSNKSREILQLESTKDETSIDNSTAVNPSEISMLYEGPSLWIHVDEFSEGMASWRLALAEILVVARHLNATFVEPCIRAGRLQACDRDGAKYRLGQVYDLDKLRQFHPHVASHADYQRIMAATAADTKSAALSFDQTRTPKKVFGVCLAHPKGSPPVRLVCGELPCLYQAERNTVLEEAARGSATGGGGVIQIRYYRKGGFLKTKLHGRKMLQPKAVKDVLENYFEFCLEHYATVDRLLEAMNITAPIFDVIHWRAEGQQGPMQYSHCADRVLETRRMVNNDTTPTILVSSLNLIATLQWTAYFQQRQAKQSLIRLLDSGFRKLDQVHRLSGDMIPDMVVLAVWDQIVSQKARHFVTCSKSCTITTAPKHQTASLASCSECNYMGNFGDMAIDMRKKYGKSSYSCWPA